MSDVAKVKELLAKLSAPELKEVIYLAEFYKEKKGGNFVNLEDELFYHTLTEKLGHVLCTSFPPLPILKKQSPQMFKKFVQVLEEFNTWLSTAFKETTITRLQKRRLYSIVVDLVVDRVEDSPVPLSLKSALNFFSDFPGLFDKNFPGYAQSGMLGMLLERGFFSTSDIAPEDNYDNS